MGCTGRLGELERWAVIWVQIAKTAGRGVGKTEPDVHLIKQVEQVTTSALEGPTWRFARIPSMGGHGRGRNPCISDLAITALAVIWLQKQPKHPEEARRPVCEGAVWQCRRPNRRFHEPGPMGCRAVAPPNSVRLIHNLGNLACCPDFQSESLPDLHCALSCSGFWERLPVKGAASGLRQQTRYAF